MSKNSNTGSIFFSGHLIIELLQNSTFNKTNLFHPWRQFFYEGTLHKNNEGGEEQHLEQIGPDSNHFQCPFNIFNLYGLIQRFPNQVAD